MCNKDYLYFLRRDKMIILGIIVTIVIGLIGASIGNGINAGELGPILSIATMGGFIMAEIRRTR